MIEAVLDLEARRARLERLLAGARAAGRTQLLEHESLRVAAELSIGVPRHVVVRDAAEAAALDLAGLPGERVVLKVLSPTLAHKTEVGGVVVVAREAAAVAAGIEAMRPRLGDLTVAGFLVAEWIPHDTETGGELLFGLRFSREFGPLVTLGLGGVTAERLAAAMSADEQPSIFSPALIGTGAVGRELERNALGALATGKVRRRSGRCDLAGLEALVRDALTFAEWAVPAPVAECEFNPLCFVEGRPIALDALVRLGTQPPRSSTPRPLQRARHLLRPRSLAVMGVSGRSVNPGRILLRNTLAAGFPPEGLRVIKPGVDAIDGVACVPDLAALEGPVDTLVLAIPASEVPDVLEQVVAERRAEGVVIVTSGIGEREGSGELARRLKGTLERARARPGWSGPLVNGANCLGLRSLPGKVDTLFIPHEKLPLSAGPPAPVALLSQSGAFAIARLSCLPWLSPRAVVTLGNQLDLTTADWLDVLAEDPQLEVFACYVEGFPTLEGARFVRRVAELSGQGRLVLLYRAGRTAEGCAASASHTASLAGDPAATRALFDQAGALVADSIEDFEGLLRLAVALAGRRVDGTGLGVVSNAGFECVAIADNLGPLRLADLTDATRARIGAVFSAARIDGFVDVHHPLDLTPIAADRPFAAAVEALLDDPGVDLGLVGCVPLTGALSTLPDELEREDGVVRRLGEVWRRTTKAWAAVVDSGALYDPFAAALEAQGIPTFRSADRASRLLGRYVAWRRAYAPQPGRGPA